MIIMGYFSAVVIGLTLGIIGGGGSILSVPALAYLFSMDEKTATAYSLFIVGSAAFVGGIRQHQNGFVDWKTALIFGLPAIIGVILTRHFIIPTLPAIIYQTEGFVLTRRMLMFGFFSFLMLIAAISMLRERKKTINKKIIKPKYLLISLEGIIVGAITGFVGAGGGFLIIPALIILAGLETKTAIGTSLIIIALKSLIGFLFGDAILMNIDWNFLTVFTSLTVLGIFIGTYINNFIDGRKLKKGFAYFVLIMAVYIFGMEFIIH